MTKPKTPRKSARMMRTEILQAGGHLLKFQQHPAASAKAVTAWETIEDKGFLVFQNGCILPHRYYRKGGFSRNHAHRASFLFTRGRMGDSDSDSDSDDDNDDDNESDSSNSSSKSNNNPTTTTTTTTTNHHGWPTTTEISHRCHWPDCCAPDHLVAEPRWKNWKRNYCGYNGKCDCGVEPGCLETFHPTAWWKDSDNWPALATDRDQVLDIVRQCMSSRITLRPADYFQKDDAKQAHRAQRKKRAKTHKEQAKRNEKRARSASSVGRKVNDKKMKKTKKKKKMKIMKTSKV